MDVSKINTFNVTRPGVTPFGENNFDANKKLLEERKRSEKQATEFLKGAAAVSAVILAAAYAAKHGVFRRKPKEQKTSVTKPVENEIKETFEELWAKRNPVKQIPAKFTKQEVPVEGERSERLKRNSIDHLIPAPLIDYSKYNKCKTPTEKESFWLSVKDRIGNMSYYRQYQALPEFLNFIKTLDPNEVKTTPISEKLKLDNLDRFMLRIIDFTEENPQFKPLFKEDKIKYADNYFNYIKGGQKLDAELRDIIFPLPDSDYALLNLKTNFFNNTENQLLFLPLEKQVESFKNYLDFIKSLGAERIQNSSIFSLNKFSREIVPQIKDLSFGIVKESPEFKPVIFNGIKDDYLDYTKDCGEYTKEIREAIFPLPAQRIDFNRNSGQEFCQNSLNKILETPYDKQLDEFKNYLGVLKEIGADRVNGVKIFELNKFSGENMIKIKDEAFKFLKENPEFRPSIIDSIKDDYLDYTKDCGAYTRELREAIFPLPDKDSASVSGYGSAFCRNSLNTILSMPVERQIEEFKNYLNVIKSVGADRVKDIKIVSVNGFKPEIAAGIKEETVRFGNENPEFKQILVRNLAEEYTDYTKDAGVWSKEIKEVVFPPADSAEAADTRLRNDFFKSSMRRIADQPDDKQVEAFKNYLGFVKELDADRVQGAKLFDLKYFSQNNLEKIRKEAADFANANPAFKPSVVDALSGEFIDYTRKCQEFPEEIKSYIFSPLKEGKSINSGQRAAFFTNSAAHIANLPAEKQLEAFREYLDFIKSIGAEQVKNSILFIPGKFAGENNLKIAEESINFAKNNPQFKDTILSNLVAYEPDREFGTRLAYSKFKLDQNDSEYNQHADNIINIRKMLTKSGLKCDEKTRVKNRQDWLDTGSPSPNRYILGFQYSPKITDIRYAAFEYDMAHGITREEADSMIKYLKAIDETGGDFSVVKLLGATLDELTAEINKAVIK